MKKLFFFQKCQTIHLCPAVQNAKIRSEDEEKRHGGRKVGRDINNESQRLTEVHGELYAASVQLQSQGVR